MSNEPLIYDKPKNGRPPIAEAQYRIWLDDMAPYLKMASTIYYAIEKADLLRHIASIYEKYRKKDWFAERIDAYRREVGEMTNNATVRLMKKIEEKLKQDITLTKDEQDFMKWFAEKHRTAQPFFVTRTEQVIKDDVEVGKILDVLDTDYESIASEASKQILALNPPIQNQEQTGSNSDVQA